jgi:hypothetical protein
VLNQEVLEPLVAEAVAVAEEHLTKPTKILNLMAVAVALVAQDKF